MSFIPPEERLLLLSSDARPCVDKLIRIARAAAAFLDASHAWLNDDVEEMPRFCREQRVFSKAVTLATAIGHSDSGQMDCASFESSGWPDDVGAGIVKCCASFGRLMAGWRWTVWESESSGREKVAVAIARHEQSMATLVTAVEPLISDAESRLNGILEKASPEVSEVEESSSALDLLKARIREVLEAPLMDGRPARIDHQAFDHQTFVRMEEATAILLSVEIKSHTRDGEREGLSKGHTVGEAATIAGVDAYVITRAVDEAVGDMKLDSNGKTGKARRIPPADLTRWILAKAKQPDRQESNEKIERSLKKHSDGR